MNPDHHVSITKGGTKITQKKIDDISEEPLIVGNRTSYMTNTGFPPHNPLDSIVMPLD